MLTTPTLGREGQEDEACKASLRVSRTAWATWYPVSKNRKTNLAISKLRIKESQSLVVNDYNLTLGRVDAGRLQVRSHPGLHGGILPQNKDKEQQRRQKSQSIPLR